jgi:exodeoxyribonuclease VII small subunit
MMNAHNEPMTFEQAMTRLEEIVRILEVGERPLEETVNLYEEGQRLRLYCEQYLADAEQRIAVIRQASDGGVIVEPHKDPFGDDAIRSVRAEANEPLLSDDAEIWVELLDDDDIFR